MNINLQARNNFKLGFKAEKSNSNFKYVDKAKIILPQGTQDNLLLNTYQAPFNNFGDGQAGAAKPVRPRQPILPTLQGGTSAQEKEPFTVEPKPVTPVIIQAGKTFIG